MSVLSIGLFLAAGLLSLTAVAELCDHSRAGHRRGDASQVEADALRRVQETIDPDDLVLYAALDGPQRYVVHHSQADPRSRFLAARLLREAHRRQSLARDIPRSGATERFAGQARDHTDAALELLGVQDWLRAEPLLAYQLKANAS
jgi:hypothetical protein